MTSSASKPQREPLAIALAVRKVMREYRKGKAVAFQTWRDVWRGFDEGQRRG